MSSSPAVLVDVDGTLVDTNYLHALAWWRALREAGKEVPMSTLHPLIGMGGDQILETVADGPSDGLSDAHTRHFEPFKDEIHAFPRAADFLEELARRGGRVILVTSAKEDDLEAILETIGAGDAISEIVRSDDVEESKPAPDLFAAAVDKYDLDPDRSLVVGDSVWDIQAAGKVGLDVVAVLTGGTTKHHLEEAGAVAVYESVSDLLDHLDESPVGELLRLGSKAS